MILKKPLLLLFCIYLFNQSVYAESTNNIESKRLADITAKQSPPLTTAIATRFSSAFFERVKKTIPIHKRTNSHASAFMQQKSPSDLLAIQQQKTPLANAPAPLLSFEGLSGNDYKSVFNSSPPTPTDANGDIGINHYVQTVNTMYQVFDKKTGASLTQPFKLSSLFAAAGDKSPCASQDQGDPIVLYDPAAKRWLLSQFNFLTKSDGSDKPPYYQCIAISSSDDPSGSYYVYHFIIPNNLFGDYPKFGVWHDGYYMTISQFKGSSYKSNAIMVFDRTQMLQGKSAGVNYHNLTANNLSVLLPSDIDGVLPPSNTPNYIIGFDSNTASMPINRLHIFEVMADFSTATSTGTIKDDGTLTTQSFNPMVCSASSLICVTQPTGFNNKQQKLDALSDRPMYRLQYRYFANTCPIDNQLNSCATLVFNHTVRGNSLNQAAVRWYLLKQNTSNKVLSIAQQGTFAPDTNSRWMASSALNKKGDLAIGYSLSSSSIYPSIAYAGRLATDAPNTLTLENRLYTGGGSQTGSERWGDYSNLAVDPVDDCTFWYTNQYYVNNNGGHNWLWHTRIGSFKLSTGC